MAAPIEEKESVIELRVVSDAPEPVCVDDSIAGPARGEQSEPSPALAGPLPIFGEAYETTELLRKDCHGELYSLHNKALNRDMCVRFIPADMLPTAESRKAFLRFCRRYVTVTHPAMVPLYSFHEEERGIWFIMEPITAPSLEDLMNGGDLKSSAGIADVFEQLVESIKALHQVGIRFGAMTPSGIFVEESGKIILRDWWAYALLQAQEGKPDPATLAYSSPEQLQGDGKLDERADIYTFGAMLFEAMTGRTPFADSDPLKLAIKIISGDPPVVEGSFANSPFAKVAWNCLQKNAQDRYSDMDQLLNDVRAAARGGPLSFKRPKQPLPQSISGRAFLLAVIMSFFVMVGVGAVYRNMLGDIGGSDQFNFTSDSPPVVQGTIGPQDDLVQQAMDAENRGDLEEAKSLWSMAVNENPSDAWNRVNLGRVQGLTKDFPGAVDTLRHAAAMDPSFAEPWYQLALVHQTQGQAKEAIADLLKATAIDPYNADYYADLTTAYVDYGDFSKAIEAGQKAVSIDPNGFDNQFNLGVAYYAADKFPQSQQAFEVAKGLSPDEPAVWTNLSLLYTKKGDHAKAITTAMEAVRMDPTDPEYLRNAAHAFANSGDLRQAERLYQRALQIDRFDAATWAGLQDLYKRMGRGADAAEAAKHLLE